MFHGIFIGAIHEFVSWLLYPVIISLFLAVLLTIIEVGLVFAERVYTLKIYRKGHINVFEDYAGKRLERGDLLARCGPILGLMGTLIPLGPGLNALGAGNIDILATALSVAFDTTVVGLLVGLVAFVVSRLRRRWYDQLWHLMQQGG